MKEVYNKFKIQHNAKLFFYIFLILILGVQNCSSYKVKEIEVDDVLEEELRADPEGYRENKTRDTKEKDNSKKPSNKK
jgi:hypothetical protein